MAIVRAEAGRKWLEPGWTVEKSYAFIFVEGNSENGSSNLCGICESLDFYYVKCVLIFSCQMGHFSGFRL